MSKPIERAGWMTTNPVTQERVEVVTREWFDEVLAAGRAYRDLAKCYRVGTTPSEALFKRLEKARKALEEVPPR